MAQQTVAPHAAAGQSVVGRRRAGYCIAWVVAVLCGLLTGVGPYGRDGGVSAQCSPGYWQNGTGSDGCIQCTGHSVSALQSGATVGGDQESETCGYAVDVSASGSVMVVGCPFYDVTGVLSDVGRVRVYGWSEGQWAQMGGDIVGEGAGDSMATQCL